MNFKGIKDKLGVTNLKLSKSNKWNDGNSTTQWYSCLLSDKVISIHNDTVVDIEKNPKCDTFGLKSLGDRISPKGFEYELLVLVKYSDQKVDKVL